MQGVPPKPCYLTAPTATLRAEGPKPGRSITELGVKVALGHPGDIVLVQELALVALLAQAPEPVLTYHHLLPTVMPERAELSWGPQSTQLGTPTFTQPGPNQPLEGIPLKGSGAQTPAAPRFVSPPGPW